jgi:hypothetical protein
MAWATRPVSERRIEHPRRSFLKTPVWNDGKNSQRATSAIAEEFL